MTYTQQIKNDGKKFGRFKKTYYLCIKLEDMLKKFMFSGWGLFILTFIYLHVLSAYFEYVVNREVAKELQIVLTLGVLVYTSYLLKLIFQYLQNNLKQNEKQND
jgi:hypothetical protein